jgi:hypothetical protein
LKTLYRALAASACFVLVASGAAAAGAPHAPAALAASTAGLQARPGLLPTYIDRKTGHILIALPAAGSDGVSAKFIYQIYLRASLGSTPVGMDRDQPGSTQILVFRRVGPKVYAEFENTDFTASGGSPEEKGAVTDSFAKSIVWSGDVKAEGPDGAMLVDITGFLTRDAYGVVEALRRSKQGSFKLDLDLSHPDLDAALAFPDNLEFEATQTFTADEPGEEVRGIAPDPHSITLITHHSLIKLPAPGFEPRLADPHFSTIDKLVTNYAAPLASPLAYRLAPRFRLEKIDPSAARSRVKKPIVFYIDRAAPEPVRSALMEGASWWAEAFDRAGYIDAFQVKLLPEGVSPLDARYNVINWVHRQTRGWSYGQGISDPRTGEIIKGSVLLGSQRIRQDRMIFEGLVGAANTGKGGPNDPTEVALARLRQLAVHETGHALGFGHNFAGSTIGRASVDDYPPPRVLIKDGALDLSDAYAKGVGAWDLFVVNWLYSEAPPEVDEKAALAKIVSDGFASGLKFVSDDDARPLGSANPAGSLWDDGPDAVTGLRHNLDVRKIALADFGPRNLPIGAPMSDLKRVIVPIYLFDRYEVDAAAKLIGGVDFTYAVNGDGHERADAVSGDRQRAALSELLRTVEPAALDLPEPLIQALNSGRSDNRDPQFEVEVFGADATPVFDLPAAADVAADLTFSAILEPSRLNRVADQGARLAGGLTTGALLGQTIDTVFTDRADDPADAGEIRRRVRMRLILDLRHAADDKRTSPTVRAEIMSALSGLQERLKTAKPSGPADKAFDRTLAADIEHPRPETAPPETLKIPPGSPIGEACEYCEGLSATRW